MCWVLILYKMDIVQNAINKAKAEKHTTEILNNDVFIAPNDILTIRDITEFYRRFLNKEILNSPRGPFLSENEPLLDFLQQYINYQIIPIEYQAGFKNTKYMTRASMTCFMTKDIYHFIQRSLALTNLLVLGAEYVELKGDSDYGIPISVTIPSIGTITRYYDSTLYFDHISQDVPLLLTNTPDDIRIDIFERLYQVHFIDPEWGRETYLFETILGCLRGWSYI